MTLEAVFGAAKRVASRTVSSLILAYLSAAFVALLVVGFVAYPYRGRRAPHAGRRFNDAVAAMVERADPGEAPPYGVLTEPEKSRRMSARFEGAERNLRRGARVLTPSRGRH